MSADATIGAKLDAMGRAAQAAQQQLARADSATKSRALLAVAEAIDQDRDGLAAANRADMDGGRANGLSAALMDRLELTPARIDSMLQGLREIAQAEDPVGAIDGLKTRPNGLQIGRMRVPLGVIGIIYESRPNVTVDAAALCIKSGNAALLRAGSEALRSACWIADKVQQGLEQAGLPRACVQIVDNPDRAAVGHMLRMQGILDVIIPRGGRGLIERLAAESRVPVIKHLDGICHVYLDDHCDADKALAIAVNAKTYRYGICGAMETLLVAQSRAQVLLPRLAQAFAAKGVTLRGCAQTQALIDCEAACDEDWACEYLAPILSIKVVSGVVEAMAHIRQYGSGHTDSIVTEHLGVSRQFLREVDSASVMVNAATCFADGQQYGLGAEIGISTDRLHVRGPVGVEGLTTQKYIVLGDGHIRE